MTVHATENLRHGSDCPAFFFAKVVKGVPANGAAVSLSAGTLTLPTGTVEFRDRSTNALLASMPATSGAEIQVIATAQIAASKVVVVPDALRDVIVVETLRWDGELPVNRMIDRTWWGPYTRSYPETAGT